MISLVDIGDTEVEYMFVKFVRFTLGKGGGVNIEHIFHAGDIY